jgi:hypothetical protein
MRSLLLNAPILPGKLDSWKRWVAGLLGERHDAYRAAIRDAGLVRLRVWHQKAPDGSNTACVLFEGSEPERFLAGISTGSDDFSAWFRAALAESHGIDFTSPPPPPPELAIDEKNAKAESADSAKVYSLSRVRAETPAAWLRVMDELRPLRGEHGQISEEILRAAEDEHEFTVRIGWQSEERARKYYAHPALRAGIERSEGIDGRGLSFLVPAG